MSVKDYSLSASANTSVGGINIGENSPAANVNNALRQIMSDVKARFDEALSVKDFGATGDGTTNDTAAIQAALNSGARVVTFPPGTYRAVSALTVPAGVFIEAAGATITIAHNGKGLVFTSGGGIRGGKITGPGGGAYLGGSIGIYCSGTSNAPAAPTYTVAPEIVGTEIADFGEYGINLLYARRGLIDQTYVHHCAYAGIGGASCEDIEVRSPRVYDITPGSPADAYGIFFDRKGEGVGSTETADPRSYRCTIINPHIQRVFATGGNGEAIDSHGGVDIEVIGGNIADCQKGIVFTRSNVNGAEALAPVRCKVIGTNITGAFTGMGVSISGAVTSGGVIVQYATDCIVSGVSVNGHGVNNTSGVGGMLLQVTKNASVTGCTFRANARNNIYLNASNLGLNISGNTFIDPRDTTYSSPACIQVGGNDNRGYIGNNTYRFDDGTLAAFVAVSCVRIEAGLTGLDLDFGPSSFQGIDATHLNMILGTTVGVRYRGMMTASGRSAVVGSSGNPYDAVDLVYPKQFPYVPEITLTPDFVTSATTRPLFQIDQSAAPPSATGIRVYVRPASGASFTTTESHGFGWVAQ